MKLFNYTNIDDAYNRIKDLVLKTPLISNENINNLTGAKVFFKFENLQWTGSFKLRGASNKISLLNKEQKNIGVVAFSSGNHAQAVSYASRLNNISATIVMPANAPFIKKNNTKKYGAKVILYDPQKEVREEIANNIANVSTKGYRKQDVRFIEYLKSFVEKPPVEGKTTDPRHITIPKPIDKPVVFEAETGLNDSGLNNVDIDREMADLAENHLFFNAGQRLIRGQFDGLRKSISGRVS